MRDLLNDGVRDHIAVDKRSRAREALLQMALAHLTHAADIPGTVSNHGGRLGERHRRQRREHGGRDDVLQHE